jgi:hypothetical protein
MRDPRLGVPWSRARLSRRGRYATYIDSAEWRARRDTWRDEWVDRYGIEPVCLVCGGRWTLHHGDLHHRSYDRLGAERFDDLVPLCRAHHSELHNLWDASPAWRCLGRPAATIGIIATLRRRESLVQHGEPHDRAC